MPAPILATKLFIPQPRPKAIHRPRLVERLDETRALTLVSAPAGFGKTSLVAEWVERRRLADRRLGVAWLSLDEADGDPFRFLLYLAAALQGIDPDCGADALAALQSPSPPSARSMLIDLINDIDGLARDIFVVLDDYHAVDSPKVDEELGFLIENLPGRMHLVIATREDPSLPLARLRARGSLTEVRAADLRFTSDEAADFLDRGMGLRLKTEEVAALESRTEGWIAGLQLAALSIQGVDDIAGFIASFTGSHRFVLDYLAEEVLRRESEGIQAFLLRTSFLDRLCGPLCDALMHGEPGMDSGQETLEYLERANLFIVPLDGERRWYRYHRLFADLLKQSLNQSLAAGGDGETGLAELQGRASRWYESNGLIIEAFRYAAASGDVDRAERLARSRQMPLHFRGAVIAILDWLASLPAAVFDARPSLRVLLATTSLIAGRPAGVEAALATAERALEGAESNGATRDLLGRIAAAKATLAVTRYQPEEILTQSRLALELLPPEDLPFRMTATWTIAIAHFMKGDRQSVAGDFDDLESMSRSVGDIFFMQLALCGLGETQEQDNRLYEAEETFRRAIALFGDHPQPNANEAHLGLARILYEWNELEAAEAEAERGLYLARQYDSAVDRFILCELQIARIKLARGLESAAAARLEALAKTARARGFLHRLPEIAALQSAVLLRSGDIEAAAAQADTSGLPLARARVFLAQGKSSSALALLEPLRNAAAAKGWKDELLKAHALEALALHGIGRFDEALPILDQTVGAAEGGGLIRLFLDEGEPMERLLVAATSGGMRQAHAGPILAAFAADRGRRTEQEVKSSPPRAQALPDPLSERELEVLRLVAEGLSNQEIGERLFLALDTIKGHNRRIFDKLDVKRRTEAIARARELGLI